jgi:hypothetical protein
MGNTERGYRAALANAKSDSAAKSLGQSLAGETKRLEVHLTIEDNGDSPREIGQTA